MKTFISIITLLFCVHPAFAEWTTDTTNKEYFWAATTNDEGHVFGQYCYHESKKCLWLIGVPTKCESSSKYPALVNSTGGSGSVELYCLSQSGGSNVLAFVNFDQIDNFVRQSDKIGIALPLENDRFRVYRFDIAGAARQLDKMRAEALRYQSKAGRKPGRGSGEYL